MVGVGKIEIAIFTATAIIFYALLSRPTTPDINGNINPASSFIARSSGIPKQVRAFSRLFSARPNKNLLLIQFELTEHGRDQMPLTRRRY